MKRWGFSGQPASHGNSLAHRAAGSTGACQVRLGIAAPLCSLQCMRLHAGSPSPLFSLLPSDPQPCLPLVLPCQPANA